MSEAPLYRLQVCPSGSFCIRRLTRSTVISTYASGQHVLRGVQGAVLALVVRQNNTSLLTPSPLKGYDSIPHGAHIPPQHRHIHKADYRVSLPQHFEGCVIKFAPRKALNIIA